MFVNVKFQSMRNHRILIDGRRLFLFFTKDRCHVVDDACPHRGGPLSFGEIDEESETVKCKWHDMRHGLCRIKANATPSIVNNGTLTIYIPDEREIDPADVLCIPV